MRFGSVWIGFEKSTQNLIRSSGFHKKNIQTHPKNILFFTVFGFFYIGLRFLVGFEHPDLDFTLNLHFKLKK
jgi:hypothetical protein